ncbi:MAG: type II toxin-antitoxin system HicB family antitoxin [Chloroflexi bacterium]|nr:type II toxin-antitoxin system HicB family antitoxin [Chloroflexota bacterium]
MDTFAFTGLILRDGDSYGALCIELDVASQGATVGEAKGMLLEAVSLYLESAIESNVPYLRPVPPQEDPRLAPSQQVVEVFPLKVDVAKGLCLTSRRLSPGR